MEIVAKLIASLNALFDKTLTGALLKSKLLRFVYPWKIGSVSMNLLIERELIVVGNAPCLIEITF